MRPSLSTDMGESSQDFEVPAEHLPSSQQEVSLQCDPEWLPSTCLVVSVTGLPSTKIRNELETCMKALILKNGTVISSKTENQIIESIVKLLSQIDYTTEEHYVWLLLYVCRLLLQKPSVGIHRFHFQLMDTLKLYNVPSLYCPVKMHLITKELLAIVHDNPNSAASIVGQIHHLNPVCHYVSINLVSALMYKLKHNRSPETFNLLSPNDIVEIAQAYESKMVEDNLQELHTFLELLSLYNTLVVLIHDIHQVHSPEVVSFLKANDKYYKHLKNWLTKALKFIERLQRKASTQDESIFHLKELIQFELLEGLENYNNIKNTTSFDYKSFI